MIGQEAQLIIELGLTRFPIMIVSSAEQEYSENYVRWRAHLPPHIIRDKNPDELIEQASLTRTIVVIGDIRRSQDLMTYSPSPETFCSHMIEFITQVRKLSNERSGFFDKFTGDGFLTYFNEAICKAAGHDYRETFVEFLDDLTEFSSSHFSNWTKEVKKIPEQPVGLAIGADLGIVSFRNVNNHLVAVGDAIVWASRMASSANANEYLGQQLALRSAARSKGCSF